MGEAPGTAPLEKLVAARLWDLPALEWSVGKAAPGPGTLGVRFRRGFRGAAPPPGADAGRLERSGYSLELEEGRCTIGYSTAESASNALSTLKQLFSRDGERFQAANLAVFDYPAVAVRSLSTTFAWYAGYGRFGFDSQLWGFEEWRQFLDLCANFKINQLNMCMYGYWPFEFPEYPDTVLQNIPMKVWNAESGN